MGEALASHEATHPAGIAQAERSTCIALRRPVDAADDARTCARRELTLCVPTRVPAAQDTRGAGRRPGPGALPGARVQPDGLVWELGRGWDGAPLEVFEPGLAA